MFWRSGDYRAVRAGDWKLQVTKRPEKARLYNLAADPTERHDLAARDPRRVAELGALIEAQNKGMAKPIWPGLVERSEEHTSELQSLMRISYAVFCLKKKIHSFLSLAFPTSPLRFISSYLSLLHVFNQLPTLPS